MERFSNENIDRAVIEVKDFLEKRGVPSLHPDFFRRFDFILYEEKFKQISASEGVYVDWGNVEHPFRENGEPSVFITVRGNGYSSELALRQDLREILEESKKYLFVEMYATLFAIYGKK